MSFVDVRSHENFWQSLDQNTRFDLFLMKIGDSFPFLRHPDLSMWARGELRSCFQEDCKLRTTWLQEVSTACLQNANCHLAELWVSDDSNLEFTSAEASSLAVSAIDAPPLDIWKSDVQKMKVEIEQTTNALLPSAGGSFGVDYNTLIPVLLLLEKRNAHWLPPPESSSSIGSSSSEEAYISTQSVLNAACHLAGRPRVESCSYAIAHPSTQSNSSNDIQDFFSVFDSKSAMKQCYQAKNVVAGANLIGGTEGFVLHVCDILNRGIGIPVSDAESFVCSDRLPDLEKIEEEHKTKTDHFELTDGHKKLLFLLDEYVLRIKTFGQFHSDNARGRVCPIFAARAVLLAWLLLSFGSDKSLSTRWLGEWLRDRLELRATSATSVTPRSQNIASGFSDLNDETRQSSNRDHEEDHYGRGSSAHDGNNRNHQDAFVASSRHRLACAALVQALLWSKDESPRLGDAMDFEKKLLLELSQISLGLVESVPPDVARAISKETPKSYTTGQRMRK